MYFEKFLWIFCPLCRKIRLCYKIMEEETKVLLWKILTIPAVYIFLIICSFLTSNAISERTRIMYESEIQAILTSRNNRTVIWFILFVVCSALSYILPSIAPTACYLSGFFLCFLSTSSLFSMFRRTPLRAAHFFSFIYTLGLAAALYVSVLQLR